MTNREVLNLMPNATLAEFLCSEELTQIKRSWTQSIYGINDWLNKEATQEFINKSVPKESLPVVNVGDYIYFPKYTLGNLDGEVAKRKVERIDRTIYLEQDEVGGRLSVIPAFYNKEWFTDVNKAKEECKRRLANNQQELNKTQFVYEGGKTCVKCGNHVFVKRQRGPHVGLYCSKCGYFVKWLNKEERKFYEDDGNITQDKDVPVVGVHDLPWE